MFVPSYQMHNVLNVYSKKLRHNITAKDQKAAEKSPSHRVNSNSEAKRRATIEKVSKDIFDKIIRLGSQTDSPHQKSEKIKRNLDKETASAQKNKAGFVFNVIDTINKKKTNTVSVEDSNFLIQRLEQLAKETMEMKKRNDEFENKEEVDSAMP